jgi:glycopeptide antibiotics resistance protein
MTDRTNLADSARLGRDIRTLSSPARTSLLPLLFAVYLGLLAWTVLWKLHAPFIGGDWMRAVKLVPFAAAEGFGPSAPFEVAMNLVVFVPFGLYLGVLAPRMWFRRATTLIAATSLLFEVLQYLMALGSSDVTDVVVNTAGGLVGIGLATLARRAWRARAAAVLTLPCLIGTLLIVPAVALHIASFPQLPPPGGGVTIVG